MTSKKEMSFLSVLFFMSSLVCLSNAQNQAQNNNSRVFEVGVVLDGSSLVGRMGLTSLSLALSDFYSVNVNYSTRLVLRVRDSKGQVIEATATVLSLLKDVKVDAIIGPQKSAQASSVIGLGDRANVPIISFSATSPYLRSQSPYFVQTTLNDAAQVGAIASVVQHFHWSQVVVIYEESDYGNGIIPHLSNAFQDVNARISYRSIIPLSATDDFILKELYKMKTMQTRVFVVHMSSSLASRFFPKVKEAEMMSKGYAWIVSSGLVDLLNYLDPNVVDTMDGVIGVNPLIPRSSVLISTTERWKKKFINDNPDISHAELNSYGVWAYDTLWALAMAAERVGVKTSISLQNTSVVNTADLFATEISQTGPKILKAVSEVRFQGLAGAFHLVDGQLGPSPFQIVNIIGNQKIEVGIWTPSQGVSRRSNNGNVVAGPSTKILKSVIFPGNSTDVPKGWQVPVAGKKLRVLVPAEAGFPDFFRWEKDPQTNASNVVGSYIDMFDAAMNRLPYSVPYEYVKYEKTDSSSNISSYDELVHQIFLQSDVAMGDITITYTRSAEVDFTLPFAGGGVTMIMLATYGNLNNKWIFLKPFTKELWLTAIFLFILIGASIWLLEHRFNSAYRGPLSQHAGMIFYFPFMSLVFAQRERIVSNLARVVVVVWMFAILILSSTYTASLSARLTVQSLQLSVSGAHELIKRGDYVGVRDVSFIVKFMKDLGFNETRIRTYQSPEDINEALIKGSDKGGISAFFAATPYTNLFLSKYCNRYTIVGKIYPSGGFAYVFQKGSPLVADVSRAVIELIDRGRISEIEGNWIKNQECDGSDVTNTATGSISLRSFIALFGITVGITAVCVIIFLVSYLYNNRDFVRRILSSNNTIWSKLRAICKHFDQRDPKSFWSKDREDHQGLNASPDLNGIPSPSTIVPMEIISDSDGDATPRPQHTSDPNQTGSADIHLDNTIRSGAH